jgi:hypothetical protein
MSPPISLCLGTILVSLWVTALVQRSSSFELQLRQRAREQAPPFEQQQLPSRLAKDYKLIGGDVLVKKIGGSERRPPFKRVKRKAMLEHYPVTNKPSRWPKNTVPYELDGDISKLPRYAAIHI